MSFQTSLIDQINNSVKKHKKLNFFKGKKSRGNPQVPVATPQQPQPPQQPQLLDQIPSNINWDDFAETRDAINAKVPGGVASVDALIKLLKENQK